LLVSYIFLLAIWSNPAADSRKGSIRIPSGNKNSSQFVRTRPRTRRQILSTCEFLEFSTKSGERNKSAKHWNLEWIVESGNMNAQPERGMNGAGVALQRGL